MNVQSVLSNKCFGMDVQRVVVEFYVSERNNIFAIFGGYKYDFATKNKNDTTRWVCRVRTCYASILTDNKHPNYQVIKFKRHVCRFDPSITCNLVKYKKLEPPYSFLDNLQYSHRLSVLYSEGIFRNVLQTTAENDEVSQFLYFLRTIAS